MKTILALFLGLSASTAFAFGDMSQGDGNNPVDQTLTASTITATGTGPGCLVAGTTALYVDCLNSRIGISTGTPLAKLDVQSATVNGTEIRLNGMQAGDTSNNLKITFHMPSSTLVDREYGTIQMLNQTSTNGGEKGQMRFFNMTGGVQGEKLTILGSNVGINQTGPAYKLHMSSGVFWNDGNAVGPQIENINSTNESLIEQDNTVAAQGSRYTAYNDAGAGLEMISYGTTKTGTVFGITRATFSVITNGSAAPLAIGNSGAQPIIFATNSLERVRLTSTGNFGIGTTSAAYSLHVSSGVLYADGNGAVPIADFRTNLTSQQYIQVKNANAGVAFGEASSTGGGMWSPVGLANAGSITTLGTNALQLGANSVVAITMLNGGNVGVGTQAPASTATFHVVGTVSISSAVNVGTFVSTQAAGGAGASVTALCQTVGVPAGNAFAQSGGCSCSGAVAETANISTPNCSTTGCMATGWTCQVSGGTGGACAAYAVCSRLQ